MISLTRAMAIDHAADGIRVNCIAPGPVYTPMVYARGMSAEAREQRRKASALGVEGTGWDIGHAVRFLLSDHARYITGQTLVVDGGVTLQARRARSARDHCIEGAMPMARVPYLDLRTCPPENQELLTRKANIYRALAHSPNGLRAFTRLGGFIRYKSRLDPRLRELAILKVGYLTRAPYEWSHHVEIGRSSASRTSDIRALIEEAEGRPSTLEPLAKAVLAAAREMTQDLAISDATFAALREGLDNERIVDLVADHRLLQRRGAPAGQPADRRRGRVPALPGRVSAAAAGTKESA